MKKPNLVALTASCVYAMTVRSLLCSVVVLSSLVSSSAAAQEARGTIQGRVVDTSGGAVPGALVEIHARAAEKAYGGRFKLYERWKAELDEEDTAREYRFYRFVARRVKVFDEREFGGAVFITATLGRGRGR